MKAFWKNLRYGFRLLWKTPALTAVTILSLAFGIGATTAIFSVVYGVLFNPLPYPESAQLVRLWESNLAEGYDRFGISPLNFLDWKARNHVFKEMAAYVTMDDYTLTGGQ
jgi:putative ABC transport system permease protein